MLDPSKILGLTRSILSKKDHNIQLHETKISTYNRFTSFQQNKTFQKILVENSCLSGFIKDEKIVTCYYSLIPDYVCVNLSLCQHPWRPRISSYILQEIHDWYSPRDASLNWYFYPNLIQSTLVKHAKD